MIPLIVFLSPSFALLCRPLWWVAGGFGGSAALVGGGVAEYEDHYRYDERAQGY